MSDLQPDWDDSHIGCRVAYTGRNAKVRYGTIKGYAHNMVNLDLEGSSREHFYVPRDTIRLIPDELLGLAAKE
jgi:hypothetical protein